MRTLRKAVLVTSLIGAGLASTTGAALASDGAGNGGTTVQKGLVNSSDFAPNTPLEACNNDPNVLGAQVRDVAGDVPLLTSTHGTAAAEPNACHTPVHAAN